MRPVTSIEELDRNILSLCTRINAATYELLVLIREFEERGGHLKWGLENCAEWLDTETGEVSTAYDNPPAGGLLSVAEKSVTEPPPPVYLH
ncbi:MAG: hypothetical protein KJP17_07240 [Gammaproteobacteria bacterium]|nr:hypothetical protein [Gammaproteobacteria bacterium]